MDFTGFVFFLFSAKVGRYPYLYWSVVVLHVGIGILEVLNPESAQNTETRTGDHH